MENCFVFDESLKNFLDAVSHITR